MIRSYYIDRSQNIGDLRKSSKEALSSPDFSNIRWIGVFGSFSRNQQTDKSDVDIIVIEKSDIEDLDLPTGSWTLEDLLPRVWCRPIDVVRILKRELRGWVAVHALLTSRTIYGDDQSEEVVQLRQSARKYLDDGQATFKTVDNDIKALQAKIAGTELEDFVKSPQVQQSIRDDLLHILNSFDIQPVWHPIHEGFWSAIIQVSAEIKRIATSKNEDREYWIKIWDIVANPSPKSIHNLSMRLEKYVFPTFKDIEERISLAQTLEDEDRIAADIDSTVPAGGGAIVGGEPVIVVRPTSPPGPHDQPATKKKNPFKKTARKLKDCVIS